MNKYKVINITTGRCIGCIIAKSLHSAKCLSPRLFGYDRFNVVYPI